MPLYILKWYFCTQSHDFILNLTQNLQQKDFWIRWHRPMDGSTDWRMVLGLSCWSAFFLFRGGTHQFLMKDFLYLWFSDISERQATSPFLFCLSVCLSIFLPVLLCVFATASVCECEWSVEPPSISPSVHQFISPSTRGWPLTSKRDIILSHYTLFLPNHVLN